MPDRSRRPRSRATDGATSHSTRLFIRLFCLLVSTYRYLPRLLDLPTISKNLPYIFLVCLPGHPGVDAVLLLEQVDGDGQRGRGRRSSESRRESIRHVGDKPGKIQ